MLTLPCVPRLIYVSPPLLFLYLVQETDTIHFVLSQLNLDYFFLLKYFFISHSPIENINTNKTGVLPLFIPRGRISFLPLLYIYWEFLSPFYTNSHIISKTYVGSQFFMFCIPFLNSLITCSKRTTTTLDMNPALAVFCTILEELLNEVTFTISARERLHKPSSSFLI